MNFKLRKKDSILLSIALVIFVGIVFFISTFLKDRLNAGRVPEIAKLDVAHMNSHTEERLTDWVYEKSFRISGKECNKIVKCSMKTNKPLLILSVIEHESQGFTPTALSRIVKQGKELPGAMGLGQIRWEDWGDALIKAGIAKEKRDLWDTETNIKATNFVLDSALKDAEGNLSKALSIYLTGKVGGPTYYENIINKNLAQLYTLVYIGKPEVKKSEIKKSVKPEIKKPEVKTEKVEEQKTKKEEETKNEIK